MKTTMTDRDAFSHLPVHACTCARNRVIEKPVTIRHIRHSGWLPVVEEWSDTHPHPQRARAFLNRLGIGERLGAALPRATAHTPRRVPRRRRTGVVRGWGRGAAATPDTAPKPRSAATPTLARDWSDGWHVAGPTTAP